MVYPDGSAVRLRRSQGRFDAREFTYANGNGNVTEVTIKVHLKPGQGVTPDDLARVRADALKGVDHYYNSGKTLPNGNRLRVNVEYTDDAADAHLAVDVHPRAGHANQVNWYVDSPPTTHAHELGHQMGLYDEYVDPMTVLAASPGRRASTTTTA